MYVETGKILHLGKCVKFTESYFGPGEQSALDKQRKNIDQVVASTFGSMLCRISVMNVLGVLEEIDEMAASPIYDPSSFIAAKPLYKEIAFPKTELDGAGLVPALVFESVANGPEPTNIAGLFPFIVVPLQVTHHIQAIVYAV